MTNGDVSDRAWKFEVHDQISKSTEDGSPVYRISRRFLSADTGNPYYHVYDESGGTRLFLAGALESSYQSLDDEDGSEQ